MGDVPELNASRFEFTCSSFFHNSRPLLSKHVSASVPSRATMCWPSVAGVALAYDELTWRCMYGTPSCAVCSQITLPLARSRLKSFQT